MKVTFDDNLPHSTVQLAGEFNSWTPADMALEQGTLFSVELNNLEPDKQYMYKYIIDGEWKLSGKEGEAVLDDGEGNLNHVLTETKDEVNDECEPEANSTEKAESIHNNDMPELENEAPVTDSAITDKSTTIDKEPTVSSPTDEANYNGISNGGMDSNELRAKAEKDNGEIPLSAESAPTQEIVNNEPESTEANSETIKQEPQFRTLDPRSQSYQSNLAEESSNSEIADTTTSEIVATPTEEVGTTSTPEVDAPTEEVNAPIITDSINDSTVESSSGSPPASSKNKGSDNGWVPTLRGQTPKKKRSFFKRIFS